MAKSIRRRDFAISVDIRPAVARRDRGSAELSTLDGAACGVF
jgi:hypothetical protein